VTVSIVADPANISVHVNDNTGNDLRNARVYIEASDGTGDLPYNASVTSITRSGTVATVTQTAHGLLTGEYVNLNGITGNKTADNAGAHQITYLTDNTYTFVTADEGDTTYSGTITATGAFINGLTDANGDITHSRVLTNSQPVKGFIRKSSTPDTGVISMSVTGGNTFTRASGSFITDGFLTGMTFTSTGFTNGGNNSTFVISTVSATEIVPVDSTGMVTEGAGADERLLAIAKRFKTFDLAGNTVDNSTGLSINARMILDE